MMDRIVSNAQAVHLDSSAELLRPQAPVHQVFLIPNVFQGSGSRFARERQHRRTAERSKSYLRDRTERIEDCVLRSAGASVVDASIGISGVSEVSVRQQVDACDEVSLE